MRKWSKKELVRGELIGTHVEIVASSDPTHVGLKGWIVDETKNTLKIEAAPVWDMMLPDGEVGSDLKIIQKKGTVAEIAPAADAVERVKIDMSKLVMRPEDRTKRLRKIR